MVYLDDMSYKKIYIDMKIKNIRELMGNNIHLPLSKYPSSWVSNYIARINNLVNPVRESNIPDLADSLYFATKNIFCDNPNIESCRKIIESLEGDGRIDESVYLRKSEKYFSISILIHVLLISFIMMGLYLYAPLDMKELFLPIVLGTLSGLIGSYLCWVGRSPNIYDVSEGKRKIDIEWSLLSAIQYPLIPTIICAVATYAMIVGVLPLDKNTGKNTAYIMLICFSIGYSEQFRNGFLKRILSFEKK